MRSAESTSCTAAKDLDESRLNAPTQSSKKLRTKDCAVVFLDKVDAPRQCEYKVNGTTLCALADKCVLADNGADTIVKKVVHKKRGGVSGDLDCK
jgi:hypothetical protein